MSMSLVSSTWLCGGIGVSGAIGSGMYVGGPGWKRVRALY